MFARDEQDKETEYSYMRQDTRSLSDQWHGNTQHYKHGKGHSWIHDHSFKGAHL